MFIVFKAERFITMVDKTYRNSRILKYNNRLTDQ